MTVPRSIARAVARDVARDITSRYETLLQQVQSLFAANDGALYINDISTMYQDAAGTTPVTSAGDPVGLWIDQSQGGEGNLGAELVEDGSGYTTDGWTASNGTLVSIGGELEFTYTGGSAPHIRTPIEAEEDESYKFLVTLRRGTTPNPNQIRVGTTPGGAQVLQLNRSSDASEEMFFTSPITGTLYISLGYGESAVGQTSYWSGVSVKRLPGNHATQSTAAARPLLKQDGGGFYYLENDQTDDQYNITVPSGGWAGTYIQATADGIIEAEFSVAAGTYSIPVNAAYSPGNTDYGLFLLDATATEAQKATVRSYFASRGAGDDFAGVTEVRDWFRNRTDITSLDLSNWNASSINDFRRFMLGAGNLTSVALPSVTSAAILMTSFAQNCTSLVELDVSSWVTSGVTDFGGLAFGCTSLTTFIVNGGTGSPFSDSPCTNYANAFANTNLTQQSIDDILVAIEAAGTSSGTFDQSGGSSPSATGEAAIDALRARSWTVTVTGGY